MAACPVESGGGSGERPTCAALALFAENRLETEGGRWRPAGQSLAHRDADVRQQQQRRQKTSPPPRHHVIIHFYPRRLYFIAQTIRNHGLQHARTLTILLQSLPLPPASSAPQLQLRSPYLPTSVVRHRSMAAIRPHPWRACARRRPLCLRPQSPRRPRPRRRAWQPRPAVLSPRTPRTNGRPRGSG